MSDKRESDQSKDDAAGNVPWGFRALLKRFKGEPKANRSKTDNANSHEDPLVRETRRLSAVTRQLVIWTRVIAGIAILAFFASLLQWDAMRGQLLAMKADQRPFIWVFKFEPPRLSSEGQIYWNVQITDYGKGIGHDIRIDRFMKIGDGNYEASYIGNKPGQFGPEEVLEIPPNKVDFITVWSRPGLNPRYFNELLGKKDAISILLEFSYTGSGKTERYVDSICVGWDSNGTTGYLDPQQCRK